MAVAVGLIGHTGADGDVLRLDDRLRRRCGRRLRRRGRIVLNVDQRTAQAVVTVGRGYRRCRRDRRCRFLFAGGFGRGLGCSRGHRRRISGPCVVRVIERYRLREVARIVKRADSQLLKPVHILVQLHMQRSVCQRGEQHAVHLHARDAGQIVLHEHLKRCAVDGSGERRRGQVDASHLGALFKRMALRISHPQRKGAVFMQRQFRLSVCKLAFTVNPGAFVHSILDFLPADVVDIRYGYLHHGAVATRPASGRGQHDSVRGCAFRIGRQQRCFCHRRCFRRCPKGKKGCLYSGQKKKCRQTQRPYAITHRHYRQMPPLFVG